MATSDPRSSILAKAYERNAPYCESLGHEFIPDFATGDFACGYCRMIRALCPVRDIDKTIEAVR